jgi:hypothetical protein
LWPTAACCTDITLPENQEELPMKKSGRNVKSWRWISLSLILAFALVSISFLPNLSPTAQAVGPNAVVYAPGWNTNFLEPNDDGSTDLVNLPFAINFFGTSYSALYVNNNGNVTFNEPLGTFTPFPIQTTGTPIIAPFFGDVWTIPCDDIPPPHTHTDVVHYGPIQFQGREAFSVTWAGVGVGYYYCGEDKLNHFQMILVNRSDVGPGDFDIVFNYDQIQWETGDASGGTGGTGGNSARIGFSNGSTASFELPGSAVNGAFLDSAPGGLIHGSRDSLQLGRYVFPVRNGLAPTGKTLSGTVFKNGAPPIALQGAIVEVCRPGSCLNAITNALGNYSVSGLEEGAYTVTANPPAGENLEPDTVGINITMDTDLDFTLNPSPPPPPSPVEPSSDNGFGTPVVFWGSPLTFTAHGCPGGTATLQITVDEVPPYVVGPVSMTETSAGSGTYTAIVPPFHPHHGLAHVVYTISCPGGGTEVTEFSIYIDPSGVVVDTFGNLIVGATVTLYRSDAPGGPFDQVPDGSAIMSPSNRQNPDTTDAVGHFGWDVIAGYYKVRAEKAGCHAPGNPGQSFVETIVLTIPPPVTDLVLVLQCPSTDTTPPIITPNVVGTLGTNGWYTSNVTVYWSVTDAESAITDQTGCSTQAVNTDTSGVTFTCQATSAGGTSSQSVTIKRDATAPTLAPAVTPSTVLLNGSATAAANAVDNLSGLASQSCGGVNTSTVGNKTLNCTATDNAGNTANSTVSYKVAYGIKLLYDPSHAKNSGSTYPIKVQLVDANGINKSTSGITLQALGTVPSPGNSQPDNFFRFTDGAYQFNVKTTGFSSGNHVLNFKVTGDPVTHSAPFRIR